MIMPKVIRLLSTLVICGFVYLETGPATAIGFLLVSAALEAILFWMRAATAQLNKITDRL